jgi:methyl-accepting chemotaxis protein
MRKVGLKMKVMVISLLITLIPLITISIFVYININQQTRNQFIQSITKETQLADNDVNIYLNTVKENTKLLSENPTVMSANSTVTSYVKNGQATYQMTPSKNGGIEEQIYNVYANFAKSHPDAAYVYMATTQGGYIQYPEGSNTANYDPRQRPFYIKAMQNPNQVSRTSAYYFKADGSTIISTVTGIKNASGKLIGVQGLDVSLKGITNMIKNIKIGKTGFLVLVQGDGTILSDPNNPALNFKKFSALNIKQIADITKINSSSQNVTFNGKPYIANVYTSPITGWKYVGLVQKADLLSEVNYINTIILLLGILFGVLVIVLSYFFARKISDPLLVLDSAAQKIASGDLTVTWNVKNNDEIGSLSTSLKMMLGNFHAIVQRIQEGAGDLRLASRELGLSTEQAAEVSTQIAQVAGGLAVGTNNQSQEVEISNEGIAQTTASVQQITSAIEEVSKLAGVATQKALDGSGSLSKAKTEMNNIGQSVDHVSQIIDDLKQRSEAVSQIVDLIENVANQTNLLALNAAIESARAGEHGRGFSVVADEVRKLAEESSQATRQIAEVIKDIQDDTKRAVEAMKASVQTVASGSKVISEGVQNFEDIKQAVTVVSEKILGVAQSSEDVNINSSNMLEAVNKIENITRDISAAGQEMAASTEEQSAALQQISASAESLSKLSQELQEVTTQFTISKM